LTEINVGEGAHKEMKRIARILAAGGLAAYAALGGLAQVAGFDGSRAWAHDAEGDHHEGGGMMSGSLEEMRAMHRGHKHHHDFEAMAEMSPEQQAQVMALMHGIGVAMPPMDPARGRRLFVAKGCVACHSVNGVGGELGPALDARDMPRPMNAFEFAARMWRGAQAMTALQEDMLGAVISLDGQDLADLVAFAHDTEEQARLSADQVPERFREFIAGE